MESCPIPTFSAEKTVCTVVAGYVKLVLMTSIVTGSLLDLKRVIYEVFCHVIQGNLKHDDVVSLLSDVAVRSRANT